MGGGRVAGVRSPGRGGGEGICEGFGTQGF